jgi:hypothetical protein
MANSTKAGSSGKITPGPWEYQTGNGGFIVRGIGGTVCEWWPASWMPEEQARMNADARLIAAAPDLLLQLEALAVQIESAPDLCVPLSVRKAIAKARSGNTTLHIVVVLAAAAVATYTILAELH